MGTVKEDAKKELQEEQAKEQKEVYKAKMKELRTARKVVQNIEKELEALDDKFEAENA